MSGIPKPDISVIFPLHSGARFLKEAIDSTLAQKVDLNFELVVALDRPEPECLTILENYNDSRMRIITSSSSGVANAHNSALFAAQGDLIAVMHSDDVMLPGRLAAQSKALRNDSKLLCVGGQLEIIDSESRYLGSANYVVGRARVRKAMETLCSIAHPTAMYRRQIAWELGGYRQESAPAEDYDFWLRMLQFGELDNLPFPVLRYRRHELQLTRRAKLGQVDAKYNALDEFYKRLRGANVDKKSSTARSRQVNFELALDSVATFRFQGRRFLAGLAAVKAFAIAPVRMARHAAIFIQGRRSVRPIPREYQ